MDSGQVQHHPTQREGKDGRGGEQRGLSLKATLVAPNILALWGHLNVSQGPQL